MKDNKTKKTTGSVTNDICQRVTDRLVALMESGVNPWQKPWASTGSDAAISRSSGKPYSLINQILLGFRPGEYLTFKQCKAEGGSVRKGAKGTQVIFWQPARMTPLEKKDDEQPKADGAEVSDDEGDAPETVRWQGAILKAYTVFHVDDCVGIERRHTCEANRRREFDPVEEAERVVSVYCGSSGVTLDIIEGDRAFYRPSTDTVTVPSRQQFAGNPQFYGTLFHELGHSTGHESRLRRLKADAFASESYSREELVAEITAATCLAELGINTSGTEKNSAAYLKAWIEFLKSDPRAIVVAAGKAEKAFRMIFNKDAA